MSKWYITTDVLSRGGEKVMGPFETQDLALEVRTLLELKNTPVTYWVDEEDSKQQAATHQIPTKKVRSSR